MFFEAKMKSYFRKIIEKKERGYYCHNNKMIFDEAGILVKVIHRIHWWKK
jgi:hypothetical protein